MERVNTTAVVPVGEGFAFLAKSTAFLVVSGVLLYGFLAATYPALHDTFHDVRHSLAIVPCH